MFYNFLRTDISFGLTLNEGSSDILSLIKIAEKDKSLLEHHTECMNKFSEFLKDTQNFFALQGFMGAGKSILLNYFTQLLQKEVLSFKFDCNEITSLDDILLSFSNQFKQQLTAHQIERPKITTADFREKINIYLKSVKNPVIIFFDSFEFILEGTSRLEIINFITQLNSLSKIKFVFSARSFNSEFIEKIGVEKYVLKPFSQTELKEIMLEQNMDTNGKIFEDFYEHTKGYYLYFTIFFELTRIFNISYQDLFAEFERRKIHFDEFIISKLLSLVPRNYDEILWYLTVLRGTANNAMLKKLDLVHKDELDYLAKIGIVCAGNVGFYLKDYFKSAIEKDIDNYTKLKIHRTLRNYYSTQLPFKPSMRDLQLSRVTLRKETEYHSSFVHQLVSNFPETKTTSFKPDMQYINYEWKSKTSEAPQAPVPQHPQEQSQAPIDKIHDGVPLTAEEMELLNMKSDNEEPHFADISAAAFEEIAYNTEYQEQQAAENIEEKEFSTNDIFSKAEESEQNYKYADAINFYKMAADKEEGDTKYIAMTKLALNQQKNNETDAALQTLNEIYNYYEQTQEKSKASYIMLNIAQINKEIYKYEQAKTMFTRILTLDCEKPNSLLARVKLDLAEIEESSSRFHVAKNLYKEALEHAKQSEDSQLLAEAYFKYALQEDDEGNIDSAMQNYLNCIKISENPEENTYLSSAYTNLASIYLERNNPNDAIKYFNLALKLDEKQSNFEGLHFIYTKLGELYQKNNDQEAMTMYMKALFAAQNLKDDFYVASTHLDIGDYYYSRQKNELALKSYLQAQKYARQKNSVENTEKIRVRIKDIAVKMGKQKFNEYMDKLRSHARKK